MILNVSWSGKHRAKLTAFCGTDGGFPGDANAETHSPAEVLKCYGALNWTGIRHPPHKSKIAYKNNFFCLLEVGACYCGNAPMNPSAGSPLLSLPVMHCQVLVHLSR